MALFERWQLAEDEQVVLLGLSDAADLARYHQGEPLADEPDLLERAGHLLAIERDLRKKYPYSPGFRDRWVKTLDMYLGNKSPLQLVRDQGIEGVRRIRRYLEVNLVP